MAQLPIPAQELSPPFPLPLQVFRPRQTCLSCSSRAGSCLASFSAALPDRVVPSSTPPKAAIVSLLKSRRDKLADVILIRFFMSFFRDAADDLVQSRNR